MTTPGKLDSKVQTTIVSQKGHLRLVVSNDFDRIIKGMVELRKVPIQEQEQLQPQILNEQEFPTTMSTRSGQVALCMWVSSVMEKIFKNFDDAAFIQHIPKTSEEPGCIELFIQTHVLRELLVGVSTARRFHLLEDNTPGAPPIATFDNLREAVIALIVADIKTTIEVHTWCHFLGKALPPL